MSIESIRREAKDRYDKAVFERNHTEAYMMAVVVANCTEDVEMHHFWAGRAQGILESMDQPRNRCYKDE